MFLKYPNGFLGEFQGNSAGPKGKQRTLGCLKFEMGPILGPVNPWTEGANFIKIMIIVS
jgi:hypothetical protein